MADQPGDEAGRSRARARAALLAGGFALWAAAVGLAYFVSENHLAGPLAIGRLWWLLIWGTAATLGGGLLLAALARPGRARCLGWLAAAGAVLLGLALLAGLLDGGVRRRVLTLLLAAMLFASAIGLGALLLRLLRVRTAWGTESLALSGSLGLGALSMAFMLLGQVGLFNPWALAAAVLAGGVLGARDLARLAVRLAAGTGRALRSGGAVGCALLVLVAALGAARLAYCFTPPLLGHADYDALEYHMAGPLEWLVNKRVSFLVHNTYANMPAGCELLYAPGLALAPDFWSAFHFTRLVGLGASVLAAFAVHAGARRLAGRRAALPAAALFFGGTWLADITVNPYIEPLLLLYVTGAWAAFVGSAARGGLDLRRTALAGALAGFAAATKYPGLVLVAGPLVVAIPAAGLLRGLGLRRTLTAGALAGGLSLAVVCPWYIRNWAASGNPVYPLAGALFPGRHWDEYRERRWKKAHRPPQDPARALWKVVAGRPVPRDPEGRSLPDHPTAWENLRTGPLLVIFLPPAICALWRRRRRGALWIGLLVLVYVLGWTLLTHQVDRFLYPAYGGLAMLAALGAAELPRRWARLLAPGTVLAGALVAAPGQVSYLNAARGSPPLRLILGLAPEEDFLEDVYERRYRATGAWRAVRAVNSLPAGSRVLLIGEARAALFRVPVTYATVWDASPLEKALHGAGDAAEAARRLRDAGVTHLYYSHPEILRLRSSYGYLELGAAERKVLADLESSRLKPVGAWGGPMVDPETRRPLRSPLTDRPIRRWELWELKPVIGEQ
jgi:hypothetical protein